MIGKLFKNQAAYFLVFVLIAVVLLFLFFPETFRPGKNAKLSTVLECNLDKVSPAVKNLTLEQAENLKLLVSFHQKPDMETVAEFSQYRIMLHLDSWILEYLVATADYKNLCYLIEDQRVSYVDIAPL